MKGKKKLANKFIKLLEKKSFEDAAIICMTLTIKQFFGDRYNLDIEKTLLPVLYAAVRGYSISMSVKYLREKKELDIHTYQTILEKLAYIKSNETSELFEFWRSIVFRVLRKFGFQKRRHLIAIDFHKKPFYGDKNLKELVTMEYKLGTCYAYGYATMCIIEEGKRFNLACIPITQFSIKEKVVRRLLKLAVRYVNIGCVLLDRGFNKVEVFKVIGRTKFIMPLVKNTKIKEILKQGSEYLEAIDYSFYEGTNREITLRVILSRIKKKHVWVTNIKGSDETLLLTIAEVYRKRWGIETGYSKANEFYPKTNTKKFRTRCFLAQLSFALQDLWVMKNFIAYFGTKYQQPRNILVKMGRKIIGFLKAFTKKLDFYWRPETPAKIFCDIMKDRIELMLC